MSKDFEETVELLEEAARRGAPLDAWVEDPEAVLRLARKAGPLFDRTLESIAHAMPPPSPIALPELIAAAALDARGAVVASDTRFDAWFGQDAVDPALAASVATRRSVSLERTIAADGAPTSIAYAASSRALNWALPPEVKAAVQNGAASVAVVAVCPSRAGPVLARAAAAYGLTLAEARLVAALVPAGGLTAAARAVGVRDSTARRTLADAMRKVGVRKQAALVSRVATTALGYWPTSASNPALLIDAFGLSDRQARIALAIARGLPRRDAGRLAGASDSVTKDEIDRIYQITGVSSAQMLSRLVTETMALGILTQVSNGELAPASEEAEPLRLIPRPTGGMIAVSDYGPADGRPVCVLHSSSTTRHVSRSFVWALQRAGFRPLSIDRPGFGVSDLMHGSEDPFEAAARDMATVCENLNLERIDIVARGGVYTALVFAREHADRVGVVVALNPDTPVEGAQTRPGMLTAITDAIVLHPDRATFLARIIMGEATSARVARLLRQALKSSPPDLTAFEDEAAVHDYQRAVRHFAAGRVEGFIAEQKALAKPTVNARGVRSDNWRMLFGAHDPLHASDHAEKHWRRLMPDARFRRLNDGGRFLFLSHPTEIVSALAR